MPRGGTGKLTRGGSRGRGRQARVPPIFDVHPMPTTVVEGSSHHRSESPNVSSEDESEEVADSQPHLDEIHSPNHDFTGDIPDGEEDPLDCHSGVPNELPDYKNIPYRVPAPDGRLMIAPVGSGFLPSKPAAKVIATVIKSKYSGPWVDWRDVKKHDEGVMWKHFQTLCTWESKYSASHMKKTFDKIASHRLADLHSRARRSDKKPPWIGEQIWHELKLYWDSEKFKEKSITNKRNRASEKGGSVHTGGCISTGQHKLRMDKEKGTDVPLHELHKKLHTRKGSNELVDSRSKQSHELLEDGIKDFLAKAEQSGKEPTEEEISEAKERIWGDIIGGWKKNRLYSAGSLAPNYRPGCSIGSSSRVDSDSQSSQQTQTRLKTLEDTLGKVTTTQDEMKDQLGTVLSILQSQQMHSRPQPPVLPQNQSHVQPQYQPPMNPHYQHSLQSPCQCQHHSQGHHFAGTFVPPTQGVPRCHQATDETSSPRTLVGHGITPANTLFGSQSYTDNPLSSPQLRASPSTTTMPMNQNFTSLLADPNYCYRPDMPAPDRQ